MDYVKPIESTKNMLEVATAKAALPVSDFLIRGFLSGAILGFATSLAYTATKQTSVPLVGALVFPVGFILIILLGLELVTGNFAVTIGNLLGGWLLIGLPMYLTYGRRSAADGSLTKIEHDGQVREFAPSER